MDVSQYPGGMYVEESGTPGSPAIVFIHGAGQSGREPPHRRTCAPPWGYQG
jgi:hypothetical protein